MRIAFLNESKQSIGGGWSFMDNLSKGLIKLGHKIVDPEDADVIIIPSSSMVSRGTVYKYYHKDIPIVLRVDNIPRNSRNRNTGTSRLRDYAQVAKKIIYQSYFARDLMRMGDFLPTGDVIYNSVDESIFNTQGPAADFKGDPVYLYSRYNRDETKNWEMVWYQYQIDFTFNNDSALVIAGNFSPDLREYNFDFFRGERVNYLGVVTDPRKMAEVYRGSDFFYASYFNDACSNTYIEAMLCGVSVIDVNGMAKTGGTPEIAECYKEFGPEYFHLPRMTYEYLELLEGVLT